MKNIHKILCIYFILFIFNLFVHIATKKGGGDSGRFHLNDGLLDANEEKSLNSGQKILFRSYISILFTMAIAVFYVIPAFVNNSSVFFGNEDLSTVRASSNGMNPFVNFAAWCTCLFLSVQFMINSSTATPVEIVSSKF